MEKKNVTVILYAIIGVLLIVIASLAYALVRASKKYKQLLYIIGVFEKGIGVLANINADETENKEIASKTEDENALKEQTFEPEPVLMLGASLAYKIGYDVQTAVHIVETTKDPRYKFYFFFRPATQEYDFFKEDIDPDLDDVSKMSTTKILSVQLIPGTDPTSLVKNAILSIIKDNDSNKEG